MRSKRYQWASRCNRPSGFTLLEVLVALLVMAIGLVGIASLQVSGLRNAHSSYYTTIASSVALDFEERLWMGMTNIDEGCIGETAVNTILTELENDWGAGTSGTITIPGLGITDNALYVPGPPDPDSGIPHWVEVRIRVTWTDERFGSGAEESFPYTARVVCAPEIAE